MLVADDDRDNAASLEALLNDEGHETRCVYNGRDVLAMVSDFQPDVVLLDIGMPGLSGYDIARELRELYGGANPLLITVTAWTKSADKLMAKSAGFDHHVSKPYDPQELLALIARGGTPSPPDNLDTHQSSALRAMRYTISLVSGYLRGELIGRSTPADTEEFLRALVAEEEKLRWPNLLISVRSSHPIFQVEQYHLSEYLRELISRPSMRVALLADTKELRAAHQYVEVLAHQRGANVRSFLNEADAITWLRAEL